MVWHSHGVHGHQTHITHLGTLLSTEAHTIVLTPTYYMSSQHSCNLEVFKYRQVLTRAWINAHSPGDRINISGKVEKVNREKQEMTS